MRYQRRELMRLFEVEVYDGDPDDPKTKILKESIVAWNALDAIRSCGKRRLVSQPVAMHHVTHPKEEDGPIFKIDSTAGPIDETEVKPSITTAPSTSDFEKKISETKRKAKAARKAKAKAKD